MICLGGWLAFRHHLGVVFISGLCYKLPISETMANKTTGTSTDTMAGEVIIVTVTTAAIKIA